MLRLLLGAAIMVFAFATLDTTNSFSEPYYCSEFNFGIVASRCYNGLLGIPAIYILATGGVIALFGLYRHARTRSGS